MQSKHKLLILDYGGVYSFPYRLENFNKIMHKVFGSTPNDNERLRIATQSRLLGENKIIPEQYVFAVSEILGLPNAPSVELFEATTVEVTNPPTPEMVELVKTVRSKGIYVSLLSDMYMFELELTKPWGRYEGFDYISFSAESGMTKANPLFFKQTLDHFQLSAHEALFVDDLLKNIEVAQQVGLDTLHADKSIYTDTESLVDAIQERLGLK